MKRDIKKILDDLYKIDTKFKLHEVELKKIIEELLMSEPDTRFDEGFALRLRKELLQEKVQVSPYLSFLSTFKYSKLSYSFVGAFVAFIVLLPLVNNNVETGLTMNQTVRNKGNNTFGQLTYNLPRGAVFKSPMESSNMSTEDTARTMMVPPSTGDAIVSISTVTPDQIQTAYVYEGEPFVLSKEKGEVFMRTKGIEAGKQIASLLEKADFGLVNLEGFDGLQAKNLELAEDKEDGYAVHANFDEGVMYVMPNWQKWNTATTKGKNGEVVPEAVVTMPTDSELIATANNFLKEHGISRDIYSEPMVDKGEVLMIAEDSVLNNTIRSAQPEQISVIYPLKLEGKEIYDESGTIYGLQVAINLLKNKVSAVNNLTSQVYESSTYALETDSEKILAYITSQGSSVDGPGNVKNIRLGTPRHILAKYMDFSEDGVAREMYIPALKFPVLSDDQVPFHKNNVIVPLVKEILESYTDPALEPMSPLISE